MHHGRVPAGPIMPPRSCHQRRCSFDHCLAEVARHKSPIMYHPPQPAAILTPRSWTKDKFHASPFPWYLTTVSCTAATSPASAATLRPMCADRAPGPLVTIAFSFHAKLAPRFLLGLHFPQDDHYFVIGCQVFLGNQYCHRKTRVLGGPAVATGTVRVGRGTVWIQRDGAVDQVLAAIFGQTRLDAHAGMLCDGHLLRKGPRRLSDLQTIAAQMVHDRRTDYHRLSEDYVAAENDTNEGMGHIRELVGDTAVATRSLSCGTNDRESE